MHLQASTQRAARLPGLQPGLARSPTRLTGVHPCLDRYPTPLQARIQAYNVPVPFQKMFDPPLTPLQDELLTLALAPS
jgi:hypothetical protein